MTNNSVNVCRYGYSAGAIGIFAAIVHVLAPVSASAWFLSPAKPAS